MAMNRHWGAAAIGILLIGFSEVQTSALSAQRDANSMSETCPSSADIASINRDLKLSFENDPTRGTQVCSTAAGSANLTLMQARVYRSLLVMRELSFDTPLPWTKDPVYRWMVKTIGGIRFRGDIQVASCCDPSNTINIPAMATGFHAYPFQGTPPSGLAIPDYPGRQVATDFRMQEAFISLVVHEARHRNGFVHTCGGRDTTIKQLGAFGAQYYFHIWVADHTPAEFITPAVRSAIRNAADRMRSLSFCEERSQDSIEDLEYSVMGAAVTAALELPGSVRMVLVSDRTVGFACESGAETGLVVGDCNGMRTERQTPEQVIATIRSAMPVVTKEIASSFLMVASKSFPLVTELNMPVRQVVWGPRSGRPLPQGPDQPQFAVYPSRVGFNPARDAALLYLGVRAMSGQAKSFGEYIFLTRNNTRWQVKGRARVWETTP